MNIDDLEIEICESPHDPLIGVHKGVRIIHRPSGKSGCCVDMPTQHANKLSAIASLRLQLLKTNS